jgi:hypothetical protein
VSPEILDSHPGKHVALFWPMPWLKVGVRMTSPKTKSRMTPGGMGVFLCANPGIKYAEICKACSGLFFKLLLFL